MAIEFRAAMTGVFNADPRAKQLEVGKVGLDPVPTFEWSNGCGRVDPTVVEVNSMKEGGLPIFFWHGGAVKESTNSNSECIIPAFDSTVLGGTVSPCWFDLIGMIR